MHPKEATELGLLSVETYEVAHASGWRTDNALITYKGETLFLAEWARRLGVDRGALEARRLRGWSDEKIIETPVRPRPEETFLTFQNRTQTLTEWATELGILRITLRKRLEAGWPIERILTTPTIPPKETRKGNYGGLILPERY